MRASASSDLDAAYGPKELEALRKRGLASNKANRRLQVAFHQGCPVP